jgi:hypothetical protein
MSGFCLACCVGVVVETARSVKEHRPQISWLLTSQTPPNHSPLSPHSRKMSDSGQGSKRLRHSTPPDADNGAYPTLHELPDISPPMPATKVRRLETVVPWIASLSESSVRLPLLSSDVSRARANVRLSNPQFGQWLKNYGYTCIVDMAYLESSANGHPFRHKLELSEFTEWRTPGVCLLSDIPIGFLQALLDGNLASKIADGHEELSSYFKDDENLWDLRKHGSFAPKIYVRILQDAAGNSPSPAQLFKVLNRLEKYASGERENDQLCTEIDQQDAASIRHGLHRYFAGNIERVCTLLTFVAALRKCLSEVPSESHHLPFSQPLQYVGFAINEQQQTAVPKKKSGWLMALFDTACKLEVQPPDKSAVFAFKNYSVACPVDWTECMLGEEVFARICKTYFYTGLGFNVHQAGLSIEVTVLDDLRHTEAWETREGLRTSNPVFETQIYFEGMVKLPEWVKVLQSQNKTPEERQAAVQADTDAEIARYEAAEPTRERFLAAIEALEKKNREEEAGIGNERLRRALYEVHVKEEREWRENMGLSDEQSRVVHDASALRNW